MSAVHKCVFCQYQSSRMDNFKRHLRSCKMKPDSAKILNKPKPEPQPMQPAPVASLQNSVDIIPAQSSTPMKQDPSIVHPEVEVSKPFGNARIPAPNFEQVQTIQTVQTTPGPGHLVQDAEIESSSTLLNDEDMLSGHGAEPLIKVKKEHTKKRHRSSSSNQWHNELIGAPTTYTATDYMLDILNRRVTEKERLVTMILQDLQSMRSEIERLKQMYPTN